MHFRAQDVVDELVGVAGVRRIGRNDHDVEEQHAAGLGDQRLKFLTGLAIDGAVVGPVAAEDVEVLEGEAGRIKLGVASGAGLLSAVAIELL